MTGIQKAFVFTLSASAAAGGTWGAYVGVRRASDAAATVTERCRNDPTPPTFTAKLRDIARETWSPTVTRETPESAGDLDPATVAELQREGIDLAEINELRAIRRAALKSGSPAEKMRLLLELKRRLNRMTARDEFDGAGPAGPYGACVSVIRKGRDVAAGVVDAVVGVWDRLIAEVDR